RPGRSARGGGARGWPATSWSRSRMDRLSLLPVGETVLVDVDVVELNAPQLLRQHVRVFAVPAGAIDDDGKVLIAGIAPLGIEFVDFLIDVRLPDRERARARNMALFVIRSRPRVEKENAFVVQCRHVVAVD